MSSRAARQRANAAAQWRSMLPTALASSAAVLVALIVGGLFLLAVKENPVTAYKALFQGAFGSKKGIAETLVAATPYILGGLSFLVAARAGLFNIGIEGQLMMGGLACGLFTAYDLGLPSYIFLPAALIVAAVAGGIWGAIAGFLKAKTGAHEVITTIMLNYLAYRINTYVFTSQAKNLPVSANLQGTDPVQPAARLPIILHGTRLHAGLIVALIAVVVVWFVLFRTTYGYRLRTVGQSPGAAAYAGISWGRTLVSAMFISGALAGLMGASEALGLQGRHYGSPPGYGFTSIAVGLVGRNHPFGMIFSGVLFGVLRAGATKMQNQVGVSKEIVQILQGLVILAVSALSATDRIRAWWRLRRGPAGPSPAVGPLTPEHPEDAPVLPVARMNGGAPAEAGP
jgi:general nucleoside transport system permease protein